MLIGNIAKAIAVLSLGAVGIIATHKYAERKTEEVRENKSRFMDMINKAAEESNSDSESHN